MKKKFVLLPFLLVFLTLILSLPCHGNLVCTGVAMDYLEYPFFWFILLIPLSLLALVLKDEKHRYWLKFTGIFFIVSMVLVYLMPEYDPGIVSMDRELTNWFLAGIYSFVSIVYFIVQFVKSRRSSQL
jgi:hypothetical protein